MYTYMHVNICDSFNDENKRLTYQFVNELIKKLCFIQSISFEAAIAMTVTVYVCIY